MKYLFKYPTILKSKISNFSFCRFELATPFIYTTFSHFLKKQNKIILIEPHKIL